MHIKVIDEDGNKCDLVQMKFDNEGKLFQLVLRIKKGDIEHFAENLENYTIVYSDN